MTSGNHLLNNGIFQLEEEVVTILGNDKQLNTDDVKVYSYEYSLGEQDIFSRDDELADDSETQDDESQSGSEDSKSIRPSSVGETRQGDPQSQAAPPSVGETRQSDPQSQAAPIVLSLGDLDNEAQQLPLNGVLGYQQNIRLLQSKSCAPAKTLLASVETRLGFPEDSAAAILGSSSSKTPFVTGIRIRGKFSEGNGEDSSTFFVSVPYLGTHDAASGELEESIGLSKFANTSDDLTPFVVHQAWFLVFGNGTVATFQSKDPPDENGSLPFPGQIRHGAFHVLAHMIAGVFQSDKSILDEFRRKSTQYRCDLQTQTTNVALGRSLAAGLLEEGDISKDLEVIVAAASVVRRQIRLLETLAKLLLCSSSSIIYYPSPDPNDFEKIENLQNIVRIPVVSQQPEQIPYAARVIEQTAKQRNEILRELDEIATQMRIAYDGILRFAAPALPVPENRAVSEGEGDGEGEASKPGSASSDQPPQIDAASGGFEKMENLLEQILEQLKNSGEGQLNLLSAQLQSVEARNKASADEAHDIISEMSSQGDVMAWQADNLSWFAVITFIFLPLGFFTQYFALDSTKGSVETQGRFWMIVGPFTFFLVLGAVFMAFGKNYGMGEVWAAIKEVRKPMTRQDVRERDWQKEKKEREERRKRAKNNMAGTSGPGSGAGQLGNSSQGGTVGSRTNSPTHTPKTEKSPTGRGTGTSPHTPSALGQGPPQQTNKRPQQQTPNPASKPSNGWRSLFRSRRARPDTGGSAV